MFKPQYKAYRKWVYQPNQEQRWYWCVKKRIPIIGIWRTVASGWAIDLSSAEVESFETKRSFEQEYESSKRLENKEVELNDYERATFIKNINQNPPFNQYLVVQEESKIEANQKDSNPDVLPIQTIDQMEIIR